MSIRWWHALGPWCSCSQLEENVCVLLLAVLNLNENLTDCKSPSDKREKLCLKFYFFLNVCCYRDTRSCILLIHLWLEASSVVGTQRVAGLEPNPQSIRHWLQIKFTKGDFIFIDLPTNQLFQKWLAAAVGHFWMTSWLCIARLNDCILYAG